MSAPVLTGPGQRLYDWLDPWAGQDPDNGYGLAWLAAAVGAQFADVDQVVGPADDGTPGWVRVFNPLTAPVWALPWLAQFPGVQLDPTAPEAIQRALIHPDPVKRGSLASLVAAAKRTLTGTQAVFAQERYGGACDALLIVTRTAETPDPAATEAAIRSPLIKPVGTVITYLTASSLTWAEATSTWTTVSGTMTWDTAATATTI
jgi:hypothetical protein